MLREVFSEKELQRKAAASWFYKRKCGFTPAMFFDLLLYCASRTETISLSQVSCQVKLMQHFKITKQSIDGRFTAEAVAFVKDFVCLLFARLILILLNMQIICNAQVYYFVKTRVYSK